MTKEHILLLRRFTRVVYLALDADDAGIQGNILLYCESSQQ